MELKKSSRKGKPTQLVYPFSFQKNSSKVKPQNQQNVVERTATVRNRLELFLLKLINLSRKCLDHLMV